MILDLYVVRSGFILSSFLASVFQGSSKKDVFNSIEAQSCLQKQVIGVSFPWKSAFSGQSLLQVIEIIFCSAPAKEINTDISVPCDCLGKTGTGLLRRETLTSQNGFIVAAYPTLG